MATSTKLRADGYQILDILPGGHVVVDAGKLYQVAVGDCVIGELLEPDEAEVMATTYNDCRPRTRATIASYADLSLIV